MKVVRPLNLVITAVGVVLGGVLSAGAAAFDEAAAALLYAVISAVCVAAGGNAVNDVFDYDVDVVNRPSRPLPSGRVSARAALAVWMVASAAGLLFAFLISLVHVVLALAAVVLLFLYSRNLKRMPFVGNVAIAGVAGLVIVYGGWAVGSPHPAMVGAAFAFLTTIAREIVKDVEDVEGDAHAGARTAPLVFGIRPVRAAASTFLLLTVVLAPLPYLLLDYTSLFLVLMLLANLMLLRAYWLFPNVPGEAAAASAWLKMAMVAGMAALFAGAGLFPEA